MAEVDTRDRWQEESRGLIASGGTPDMVLADMPRSDVPDG